jgi:hypothetical protein
LALLGIVQNLIDNVSALERLRDGIRQRRDRSRHDCSVYLRGSCEAFIAIAAAAY